MAKTYKTKRKNRIHYGSWAFDIILVIFIHLSVSECTFGITFKQQNDFYRTGDVLPERADGGRI